MKRILVGLDGSTRAPHVLSVAVNAARVHGARLILLRAIGLPAEVPQDLWKCSDQSLLDVLRETCTAYLNEQVGHVPEDLLEKAVTRVGAPWQALCQTAAEEGADLVVVGSHGYSGIDHLLGTTAAKVVNHAPCSVLVVREPHAVPRATR